MVNNALGITKNPKVKDWLDEWGPGGKRQVKKETRKAIRQGGRRLIRKEVGEY